ncbi:hypothetical protein BN903_50 [Halorubrum sp. AJ67]|nr:hypothetical protein BN903_50 [Halorubrum sp. AJ67]
MPLGHGETVGSPSPNPRVPVAAAIVSRPRRLPNLTDTRLPTGIINLDRQK